MLIHVRHLRRNYWTARFASFPHPQHVGEGRTKAEAIGALIVITAARDDIHGGPVVTELPKGEFHQQSIERY